MVTGRWVLPATAALLAAGVTTAAALDAPPPASETVPLWPGEPPGPAGDLAAGPPGLTVYRPAPGKGTGTAVVICPGGGYRALMETYEGSEVAAWLVRQGVAGVVLRYRVGCRHPGPMLDGQRAIRLVRAHAREWGLDPKRIGMMGFSAGGHLAATVGTHFDAGRRSAADPVERQSCRPDFLVLVYPVITLGLKTHAGSREVLLGPTPDPEAVRALSNELQVTRRAPPTFLAHARTDSAVPVENSRLFHDALGAHGVPSELLELPVGEHGLGCGTGPWWQAWQDACARWMAERGLVARRRVTAGN